MRKMTQKEWRTAKWAMSVVNNVLDCIQLLIPESFTHKNPQVVKIEWWCLLWLYTTDIQIDLFIYRASVSIKIVSKCFPETQGQTSNKQGKEKLLFNRKKTWAGHRRINTYIKYIQHANILIKWTIKARAERVRGIRGQRSTGQHTTRGTINVWYLYHHL